jgi:hypothetical protein
MNQMLDPMLSQPIFEVPGLLGFYLMTGLFIPAVWRKVSSSFSRFKEPHNDDVPCSTFSPLKVRAVCSFEAVGISNPGT